MQFEAKLNEQIDLALVFGTVKIIKLKGKQNAKANKIYSGI